MKRFGIHLLASAAVGLSGLAVMASPSGTQTVLKIDHTQDGTFTSFPGGPNGDDAEAHTGQAGDIARVYWVVPNSVDPSPELYNIQWWNPVGANNAFQPFEVQYNGVAGDSSGFDPNIPWHGQFGTNHQYVSNNGTNLTGQYDTTGPGPQSPGDASDGTQSGSGFPANPQQADGTSVWLKPGSEIFVKWDFGFYTSPTTNAVSDLLLTQVTQTPEPTSLSLLALVGGTALCRRRRSA